MVAPLVVVAMEAITAPFWAPFVAAEVMVGVATVVVVPPPPHVPQVAVPPPPPPQPLNNPHTRIIAVSIDAPARMFAPCSMRFELGSNRRIHQTTDVTISQTQVESDDSFRIRGSNKRGCPTGQFPAPRRAPFRLRKKYGRRGAV